MNEYRQSHRIGSVALLKVHSVNWGEGKRMLLQVESPKVFAVSLGSVNVDGIEERVQ